MRRAEDIFELQQRMVGGRAGEGENIDTVKDVERCSAELARLQGRDEHCFVDDRAAGRVDEDCGRLHLGELRGRDQATGFGHEWQMD